MSLKESMNQFNLLTVVKFWLVILCLTLFLGSAFAAVEVELYQERVVVSQNAAQREQDDAIKTAFDRLIVRVTGVQQSLTNAAIQQASRSGSQYLASFRFDTSNVFFTNVLGERVPTKTMVLDFDKQAIDNLLIQNRLPVWGARRPEVLVWLADRSEGRDHILSDSEVSTLSDRVTSTAQARGVPIILPIMDLTDTLAMSFAELFGLFSQDIEQASQRYSADAVLAGKIVRSGNEYSADWLLIFRSERIRLPTVSGSLDSVVSRGIDMVAQRMSEQYALILDPLLLGNLELKVVDIPNLNTFAEVESYLNSVNLITKATVRSFNQQSVTFDVQISGDQFQLTDVLALDGQLRPVDEAGLQDQLDRELVFQWSPRPR